MPTYRYPIVLWRDGAGAFTGAAVGDFGTVAASDATEDSVMRQLREFLEWRFESEPWNVDPDLTDPALIEVKVEVRPQYRTRKRIIPCPETVWLRIPCVTGMQVSGLRLCILPHFSLQFSYREHVELKGLVGHYVKESLQTLSSAQLAGFLPPSGCVLKELVLRDSALRVKQIGFAERREMKILFTVADPLLHDSTRKRAVSAAYGREQLVQTVAQKLGREQANVLLVGESSVGKTTVLFDAAKQLARRSDSAKAGKEGDNQFSESEQRTYRFWRGSGSRIVAGMRYLGEWEERCEAFIAQLGKIEGVFCAENLLELAQVGGQGPGDSVAAFLVPYVQRGELRMVAEATPAEVEACRRLLPGLLDVFQLITVPNMDDTAAVQAINRVASAQGSGLRLQIEPGTVGLVHGLHKRFKPYSPSPGPAAEFVRTLFDRQARRDNHKGVKSISARNVIDLFVEQTGLPEVFLRDDLLLRMVDVREHFASRIMGQPDATLAAARLVTTIKAGLTDPARPLGVLLFSGPTGVGKTALARTLVDYCFGAGGQKDRLVRLDMSEYSNWGAAQRLVQNPLGQPAAWIQKVRRQPFCMVLFDEIEKAAPEVFDVLLGLMDEGRLTDKFGRTTWFRSAIVIMTSNLGANAPASVGFSSDAGTNYESEVSKFFRPEFFNRLDAVIAFKPLSHDEVASIARKELADMASREGLLASGIRLDWTQQLIDRLVREGYDHQFGARPLQRAIERLVVTALAHWKVAHSDVKNARLLIDLDTNGNICIKPY